MTGIEKTKSLQRIDVPITELLPNELNPNKMSQRAFDLLVDNIQKTGLTDPILVREIDPAKDGPRYRIVGGHHRYDAARYLGFDTVPVTVITDPDFDEEAEQFQLVRMNVIRGRMDPDSFFSLYNKLSSKYADHMLQDLFGFSEEAEFRKLIDRSAQQLPKDLQAKFKEAAKEIKTIDDLAKLLNRMFTQYGDSLPYGYMVVDFGGQDSIWLRASKRTMNACYATGVICRERKRTLDDVIGKIVEKIAKGELKDVLEDVIAHSPEVVLPSGFSVTPTKDQIDQVMTLQAEL